MFYVYVLRSEKTGRRYVGSCQDVQERLRRHNTGHSKATRHGIPRSLERFKNDMSYIRKTRTSLGHHGL